MQCGNDNRLLTQASLEDNLSQDQNSDLTAGTLDLSARPSERGTHLVCLSSGSKAGGLSTEVRPESYKNQLLPVNLVSSGKLSRTGKATCKEVLIKWFPFGRLMKITPNARNDWC